MCEKKSTPVALVRDRAGQQQRRLFRILKSQAVELEKMPSYLQSVLVLKFE